ncbi:hypothetical protein [Synechococcus sp. MU1648]|uniref:hypothetical protein n=1 Tax=Synechococcus sp. MU1648 TaxID=2508351 RepID=UPI001D679582|nr:hypothetical protein [Synechococcus sp. MU1648]MCB4377163.1 hypothetical protein [Synechococcus sp. MU1650]
MHKASSSIALLAILCGFVTPPADSAELSKAQQLAMYRNCRAEFSHRNLYFAKKMCGCLVQGYMHGVPVQAATPKCIAYATVNE